MHHTKRWIISGNDSAAAEALGLKLKVSPIVAQVLLNRGLNEPGECQGFPAAQPEVLA